MKTSNLALLNASGRRRLADWLAGVLDRWQEDWCAGCRVAPTIEILDPFDAGGHEARRWWCGRHADGRRAWIGMADAAQATLSLFMPGAIEADAGQEAAEVCREIERCAFEALAGDLLQTPGAPPAAISWSERPPEPALLRPLSGAALTRCGFEGVDIYVVSDAALTAQVLCEDSVAAGSTARVLPLREAAASQRVAVEVSLDSAELLLTEVAALAPGDVIAVPHSLAAPLPMRLVGGGALCTGHLGATGGRRAIQLTGSREGNNEV